MATHSPADDGERGMVERTDLTGVAFIFDGANAVQCNHSTVRPRYSRSDLHAGLSIDKTTLHTLSRAAALQIRQHTRTRKHGAAQRGDQNIRAQPQEAHQVVARGCMKVELADNEGCC